MATDTNTRHVSARDQLTKNDHVRAVDRVFRIPELLHQILVCLAERPQTAESETRGGWYRRPQICNLFALQRINRFWYSSIQGSTPLRKAMWLTADSTTTLMDEPATLTNLASPRYNYSKPCHNFHGHHFTVGSVYMKSGFLVILKGQPATPGSMAQRTVSPAAAELLTQTTHFDLFNPIARSCRLRLYDGTRYTLAAFSFGLGCNRGHAGVLGWHATFVRCDESTRKTTPENGEFTLSKRPGSKRAGRSRESWRDVLMAQPGASGFYVDVFDHQVCGRQRSCLGEKKFEAQSTLGEMAEFVQSCHRDHWRKEKEKERVERERYQANVYLSPMHR